MATLSTALNHAMSGLSVASAQSAIASRNVAFASDPNYARRSAEIISLPGGSASLGAQTRNADARLLERLLGSTSGSAGSQVTLDALSRLAGIVGDPQDESSVPALLVKLQQSLRSFEANPSSQPLALSVLDSARDMVEKLASASGTVQSVRLDADRDVAALVQRVSALLEQFKIVNDAIVRGTGSPTELTDSLDERDRILKLLAEDIGIRTVTRANNDIAIYTDSGVTLFETSPRTIGFTPTTAYSAATTGNAVTIDGVGISGAGSPMPILSGRLQSLMAMRDELAPAIQTQLDESARALIGIFAESDQQDPPSLPVLAGLITDQGNATIPLAGPPSVGLASRLMLHPSASANPFLIRDGGFNGAAYVSNSTGGASYQDRLAILQGLFDAPFAFDAGAGLGTGISIKSFSINASARIESLRQAADLEHTQAQARQGRANSALSRITGVNLDEEMAALLDLEKSYQASAKVMATVDNMLATLLEAVR